MISAPGVSAGLEPSWRPRWGVHPRTRRCRGRTTHTARMVREPAPWVPAQAPAGRRPSPAIEDAVDRQEREPYRVGLGRAPCKGHEHIRQSEIIVDLAPRLAGPVVEIAGDDEGRIVRDVRADALAQDPELPPPLDRAQPEMDADDMHRPLGLGGLDHAVQHAAAREPAARDVDVLPGHDGVLAQDGIAVVTGVVDGILAVGLVGQIPPARNWSWGMSGQSSMKRSR